MAISFLPFCLPWWAAGLQYQQCHTNSAGSEALHTLVYQCPARTLPFTALQVLVQSYQEEFLLGIKV